MTYRPSTPSLTLALARVLDEAEALLLSKQRDYGPEAISRSPMGADIGVLVRMHDKMSRLVHLTTKANHPNYEAVEDTAFDLLCYAAILVLVLRKEWPGL